MYHCIAGAAAVLLGREGSGGCGPTSALLPGQEGSGVRLTKGSDNEHVVGGGVWLGAGVGESIAFTMAAVGMKSLCGKTRGCGGGTVSTTAADRNNVPCASRSAAGASLQGWKLSCSGKGEVAAMTVAMAAAAIMPSHRRL